MFKPKLYDPPQIQQSSKTPESMRDLWSDHNDAKQHLDDLESQLHDVRSQRSRTPAHQREELLDKDREIESLQNAVYALQLTIQKQEEVLRQKDIRINQQAATIQIHSDEIAKSHKRYTKFEASPIRLPSQQGQPKVFQDQGPPPSYEVPAAPRAETGQHFRTKWGVMPYNQEMHPPTTLGKDEFDNHNPPAFYSPRRLNQHRVNDAGSPLSIHRGGNLALTNCDKSNDRIASASPLRGPQPPTTTKNGNLTFSSMQGDGRIATPPVPPITPVRSDSAISKPRSTKEGAISQYGSSSSREATTSNVFSSLFDHIVEFAYFYTNVPSTLADSNLPQELKQRLMNAATKTTAHKIMSSQSTRYLLIAKIIIFWIQVNVFREQAFFGLDQNIDNSISETRKKIFNNTPGPVRFVFLRDIANQFSKLSKAVNYADFVNSASQKRATELWSIVRPLMYHKIEGDWQALLNLVKEAHCVAEMQVTDPAEFRLFFPKFSDPFNDASMMSMDPEFDNMSPDEIMARRANVRLGAIPQVMVRVTSPDGIVSTKTLVKAGVLLRFGADPKK